MLVIVEYGRSVHLAPTPEFRFSFLHPGVFFFQAVSFGDDPSIQICFSPVAIRAKNIAVSKRVVRAERSWDNVVIMNVSWPEWGLAFFTLSIGSIIGLGLRGLGEFGSFPPVRHEIQLRAQRLP